MKKLEDIIDGDRNTDKRTWRRNVGLGRDIYSDITFFTAAWTGGCIRENVEDCTGQMDINIISDHIICLECAFPQDTV